MDKPNCYECVHRGKVAGSAHSSCEHPANKEVLTNPIMQLTSIFASVGRATPIQADTGLHVRGKPHGIRSGWFNWPFNFDPIWLETCDGFEAKEDTDSK